MDVAIILTELKLNLHEKRVNNFVPHQAKCILEKLQKDGEVNANFFLNQTICFYEKCESYLDVYRHAYEGVTPHLWLNSSEDLSWKTVCASAEKINSMFAKQIIDIDALFNEHVLVKNYISASRDVAAALQTPQLGGGPRPTLGAQVSLKLLFGYVTIFSSADLFTTDLNCRKKLACDIISECDVILSRRI